MDKNALQQLKTLLVGKRLKIAVAESITCGRLQAALGSVSGSSAFFEGGVTAYNLQQKSRLLAIDEQHANAVNSVSQRVAFELAEGACRMFQSDIGIGITGYAEPSPENEVFEPMAYYALCRRHGADIVRIAGEYVSGNSLNRVQMQKHAAEKAVNALLAYAETCEPVEPLPNNP